MERGASELKRLHRLCLPLVLARVRMWLLKRRGFMTLAGAICLVLMIRRWLF